VRVNVASETAPPLGPLRKITYSLGDVTLNTALSALTIVYAQYFLVQIADVRAVLAGAIPLIGRTVDAFFDPLMGRISDRTRWRAGRRRPWFLIGALPYGLSFAGLFAAWPGEGAAALFLAYAGVYVANVVFSTILAVPYMSLLPEMALGYDERTSANVYRQIGAVSGVLLTALVVQPLVALFGGGAAGWAGAGAVLGAWVAVPWIGVHRVSFERAGFRREVSLGFVAGLRRVASHRAYRRLLGLFLAARIALDVAGALFLFYFTYWLGRSGDFSVGVALLLVTGMAALPLWLAWARRVEKRVVFAAGAAWWIVVQLGLLVLGPEHPRWLAFVVVALAGIGYTIVDLMPWSMLGDVIDADELETGERREGVYAGLFTFTRKLGGALGVALAGVVLDLAGFVPGREQPPGAILAIRGLTALAPIGLLAVAVAVSRSYPIGRERHARITEALARRAFENGPGR
jgi:sugar (glycoside-pentoside-hexuronide) transporter